MKNTHNKSESEILRQQAEELLKKKPPRTSSQLTEAEMMKLIHELDVRQLELELQQEKLKQTEEKYQLIIQSQSEGISVVDENEIFEFANLAAAKIFETEPDALVGASLYDFLNPAEIEKISHQTGIRKNGIANIYELQIVTKKGNTRYIQVNASPRFDENNNFLGSYAVFSDITERRQAEDELLQSHARYSSMISNISDVIAIMDADGFKKYESPNFQKFFGWLPEENAGRSAFSFAHPDDIPNVQKVFSSLLEEDNSVKTFEFRFQCKDGSYKPIEITVSNLLNDPLINGIMVSFHDITERKQTEDELLQSHARYTSMISNISDVIGIMGADGIMTYKSPNIEKWFGWLPEDRVGTSGFSTVHPDDLDRVGKVFYSLFDKDNAIKTLEFRYQCKDGSYKPIELTAANLLNDPFIRGVLLNYRDITERKQAEELLHNERLLLRTLIDNIPYSIYSKDIACRKTLANSAEVHIVRAKSEKEVLGKDDFAFYPKEMADSFFADDQLVLQTGKPVLNREEYIFNENEEKRWLLTSKLPLRNLDGQIIGLVGIGHDITVRKQMEEELKQTSARLALATRAGGVGVWDYDIDNNIVVWDDQMIALYGLDKKNFSGDYEAWQEALHPDDRVRGDQEIQMAISGKKEFNTEFRVVWSDGTVRYVRALAVVQRDDSGKALRMVGTNWDITAWKNAEEELRASEENLQKINAEKDKFFSIISHDLRGPFNGFLGLTRLMAEELPGLTQEEIQKMAGSMRDSATNLFNLLEDLLEWSRMHQGGIIFNPESIWLMSIMNESMRPVIDLANKKGVEIRYEIQADLEMFADAYMLASTIRNLASNAVKFTLKGGKVTIAAKSVPGHSVEISVSDTGIGMSPEMVADLFRLDTKTNRRGTENEPSSGLGLLLCKDFIEKHGENIWVESEEGKGSTFYFTLPAAPPRNR